MPSLRQGPLTGGSIEMTTASEYDTSGSEKSVIEPAHGHVNAVQGTTAMPTLRTIAVVAALALGTTALSSGANSQISCDWYANTALQQQKVNNDRKCGLKGESWSFDRNSHLAWCQSASPDEWKRQAQLRDQELAKCVAGTRR